jgi:hypothetical protein
MVTYLHYWQFEWGFGKFHPIFWCKIDVIQLVLIIVGQTTSLVLTINTWRIALFGNEVCNFMCLFYMSWTIVCKLCAKSLSLKDALVKRSIRNTVISVLLGVFEFVRNMKTRIFPSFFFWKHTLSQLGPSILFTNPLCDLAKKKGIWNEYIYYPSYLADKKNEMWWMADLLGERIELTVFILDLVWDSFSFS